jgi:hypothetical protein
LLITWLSHACVLRTRRGTGSENSC